MWVATPTQGRTSDVYITTRNSSKTSYNAAMKSLQHEELTVLKGSLPEEG